ncbi:hypothetical protein FRC14_008197 [Serendipita sp. 396]|nr:hypothetical protein FRC14_008197 [Serendipita sp. 396]KAG8786318.1 hypothetical protein FRC15_011635 [Serendipita sp. 397]KAG8870334.1 hypothetical protein FRC20_011983 [Serendipita sp. 405]
METEINPDTLEMETKMAAVPPTLVNSRPAAPSQSDQSSQAEYSMHLFITASQPNSPALSTASFAMECSAQFGGIDDLWTDDGRAVLEGSQKAIRKDQQSITAKMKQTVHPGPVIVDDLPCSRSQCQAQSTRSGYHGLNLEIKDHHHCSSSLCSYYIDIPPPQYRSFESLLLPSQPGEFTSETDLTNYADLHTALPDPVPNVSEAAERAISTGKYESIGQRKVTGVDASHISRSRTPPRACMGTVKYDGKSGIELWVQCAKMRADAYKVQYPENKLPSSLLKPFLMVDSLNRVAKCNYPGCELWVTLEPRTPISGMMARVRGRSSSNLNGVYDHLRREHFGQPIPL